MNIHIDLDNKDYNVSTFGGRCITDDMDMDSFGIQIEDFSLSMTSKTAADLVKKLKEHLDANIIKYE